MLQLPVEPVMLRYSSNQDCMNPEMNLSEGGPFIARVIKVMSIVFHKQYIPLVYRPQSPNTDRVQALKPRGHVAKVVGGIAKLAFGKARACAHGYGAASIIGGIAEEGPGQDGAYIDS
jgi:hypothetical protein